MSFGLLPLVVSSLIGPQVVVSQTPGGWQIALQGQAPFHVAAKRPGGLTSFREGSATVVTWREGAAAFSAVAPGGGPVARVAESSGLLRLKYREFDPTKVAPAVPEGLAATGEGRDCVVQFVSQPLEEYRQALAGLGARVMQYLPDDAYVVDVPVGKLDDVRALPFVRWAGPFQPAFRVELAILDDLAAGRYSSTRLYVQVSTDDPIMKAQVAARAQLAGVQILDSPAEGTLMEVFADADGVRRLAHLDGVLWIERRTEPSSDMDNVRIVSGANAVQTAGGFQGEGVNAHVIDAGFLRTHVDYASRLTVRGNPAVDSHGTATAGIVSGNGTANAAGKGMMPLSGLVVSAYQTNWSAAGRLSHTQATVDTFNCVVESNSWGDNQTGAYTSISSYMDEIVYKTDLVILNSMSNLGNNSQVRPQAWAKNVVGIGAVNHFNNTNLADDRWSSGASIGPAADLRIKPDLAFYYDSIFCPTSSSNTAYTSSFGGTSAATPMSAGAFGLFFEMWHKGVFGNSSLGATVFANRAKSATARAFMVNSAYLYNAQADINRNVQGWGLPNLSNLWNMRDKVFWVNETDVLLNLEEKTYRVYVPGGTPEFRATMVYTDYWAAANANPTRLNNLSLKVVGPSSTTYWGNNGMSGSGGANTTAPGGSADTRNTTQNVYIANPAAGVYTVTVKAESLVQDGRPETPGVIDADYGLVVSGVAASATPASVGPWGKSLLTGTASLLGTSDNNKLEVARPLAPTVSGPNLMGAVVGSTLAFASPTKLDLLVEADSNFSGTSLSVSYFNFVTGQFEAVSTHPVGTAKTAVVATPSGDLSRFVQPGTRAVRAALVFGRSQTPAESPLWRGFLDHVRWQAAP